MKYGFGRVILGSGGEYLVRCAVRFGGSGLVKMLGPNEVTEPSTGPGCAGCVLPFGVTRPG